MAQTTLSWVPAGGVNSLSQAVQYRKKGDTAWTTFSTETPSISSKTVTGLLDNQLYEFRVLNHCAVGGDISSGMMEGVKFTCPTVTYTKTYESITVSFSHLGGSIDAYDVKLYNSANTLISTYSVSSPLNSTITHTFDSLSPASTYTVRVVPHAEGYSKTDCLVTTITTNDAPTCSAPTVLSANMG